MYCLLPHLLELFTNLKTEIQAVANVTAAFFNVKQLKKGPHCQCSRFDQHSQSAYVETMSLHFLMLNSLRSVFCCIKLKCK
jgi:hypothetical protein